MRQQEGGVDQAGLRAALMQLVQLATARRLRQPDPPGRLEEFTRRMEEVLGVGEPVVLTVRGDEVLHDETRMLGEDLLSRHLCRSLYDEGLRAIFVEPGCAALELEQLCDLLARDWQSRAVFEPDLPTAAWQTRFAAIHLDVVASRLATESPDEGALVGALMQQLASPEMAIEGEAGALLGRLRGVEAQARAWSAYQEESSCAVAHPEASESLHRSLEVLRADQDVTDTQVGQILLETLRSAPDTETIEALAASLRRHIEEALAAGRPEGVALLRPALLLLEADLLPEWPSLVVLAEALRPLGGPSLWAAVARGWEVRPEPAAWRGAMFTLTSVLPAQDAPEVARAAAVLPARVLREAVADGLALVLQRAGLPLLPLLEQAGPEGQNVALLAMARSDDATGVEKVLARWASAEPAAREAVLVAVRRQQSPRIKAIARGALEDADEAVRLEALRYLAVYRDAEGGARIAARLSAVVPGVASEAELRALTRALVVIQGPQALEALKALALRPDIEQTHPELLGAVLAGLFSAGRPGAAVLDQLGLARPTLRESIRQILGSR